MTLSGNSTQPFIRVASQTDAEAIIHLDEESNPHPWGGNLIKDALRTRQNWLIETANEQGKMTIIAWLTASMLFEQSELELIVVDKHWRRQGLAKRLMQHWLAAFAEQSVREYLLEVRESNVGAISLYQSLGFEQVGRRRNYYQSEQGSEAALLFTTTI